MLTENNPNLRMVLVRNPNFHGERYPGEGPPEAREGGLLDDAGRPMPSHRSRGVFAGERGVIPRWNKFRKAITTTPGSVSDSFDQAAVRQRR